MELALGEQDVREEGLAPADAEKENSYNQDAALDVVFVLGTVLECVAKECGWMVRCPTSRIYIPILGKNWKSKRKPLNDS